MKKEVEIDDGWIKKLDTQEFRNELYGKNFTKQIQGVKVKKINNVLVQWAYGDKGFLDLKIYVIDKKNDTVRQCFEYHGKNEKWGNRKIKISNIIPSTGLNESRDVSEIPMGFQKLRNLIQEVEKRELDSSDIEKTLRKIDTQINGSLSSFRGTFNIKSPKKLEDKKEIIIEKSSDMKQHFF